MSRHTNRLRHCVHFVLPFAFAALPGMLSGCQSTGSTEVHQFDPMPRVEIGATELKPVSGRPVTDLLRDAEKSFNLANAAQEQGDSAQALKHYSRMLELLLDADMDPAIFYSLREQFGDGPIDAARMARRDTYYDRHSANSVGTRTHLSANEIRIPFPLPERVLVEIEEIQNLYPRGFQIGLNRSYAYMPYIQNEFRKAGLPPELGWICMVESQFNEKIDSRAGAGGMWQFMRTTGKRYNLRVDNYVDERYDWKSSTHAAAEMLSYLYNYFGDDWSLAISAYNMGEGGLGRAIDANGGMRDYWQLLETPPASDRIRQETKKYYPRFLASVIVASNPERYGFTRSPMPVVETSRVPVKGMYALDDLDRVMGYSDGTLAKHNPDLIRGVTPPSGEYAVNLPVQDRARFMAALESVSQTRDVVVARGGGSEAGKGTGATHKVRRGETISKIARRYGVSASDLMKHNKIRSARDLQSDQILRIPGRGAETARGGSDTETVRETSKDAPAPARTYVVKRGDTLSEVASRHGVSMRAIQDQNGMGRSTKLQVNQKIKVPGEASGGGSTAPAPAPTLYHEVKPGEYPAKIARAYGMSVDSLLSLNNLSADSPIQPGQKLKVTGRGSGATPAGSAPSAAPATIEHIVARGETASSIAEKYGATTKDVLAWNKLTSRSVLRVDQKLVVQGSRGSASANNPAQTHTVAAGHNPTMIARRYGVNVSDLYKWNNWPRNHVLQVGDKVVILK